MHEFEPYSDDAVLAGFAAHLDDAELVGFVRELLRIPSLSLEEADVAAAVAARMRSLGYDAVRTDSLHNVVGVIEGTHGAAAGGDSPTLLFNGHIDHAGVGAMAEPFSGDVRDGGPWGVDGDVVCGRGASDMKAAVACMVLAGGLVRRAGVRLRGDVIVTCVAREEMARGEGILALLDGGLKADQAVSGEASNLDVMLGHRGKLELAVTTHGRTAHGGLPEAGINAVYLMHDFITELRTNYPLPTHDFLGRATASVLDISASPGALTPIVPDGCRAVIDRRYLPDENAEMVMGELWAMCERVRARTPEFRADVELLKDFPVMFTPPETDIVQAMQRARHAVLGDSGALRSWYFGVDGTFLNRAGIPCVGFGPGDEKLAHTPEDAVPVAHLAPSALTYAALMAEVCG